MSYSIYIYTSLKKKKKKGLFLKEKKQDIFNIAIKTQHLLQQASNIFFVLTSWRTNSLLPENPMPNFFLLWRCLHSNWKIQGFVVFGGVFVIGVMAWTGLSIWFLDVQTSSPGCCRNVWGRFHPPSGSVAWATHSVKVARWTLLQRRSSLYL